MLNSGLLTKVTDKLYYVKLYQVHLDTEIWNVSNILNMLIKAGKECVIYDTSSFNRVSGLFRIQRKFHLTKTIVIYMY